MSTGAEKAVDIEGPPAYDYPEGFATNDAVYTLHAVEFAPPSNPDIGSIFDDPSADIKQTWERAEKVGGAISSADQEEVDRRLREARETVREVMQRLAESTQAAEAATEDQADSNS